MVGNDIIDLGWARRETNWRRKGYLEKVFTGHEQQLIQASTNPFCTIWQLWSMKESAYKLFIQAGYDRFFNPLRLSCRICSKKKGIVIVDELQIHTRSEYHSRYIFTRAFSTEKDETANHVFHLSKSNPDFQSKFTHSQILGHIAREFNLQKSRLNIRKSDQNVPGVFYNGEKLNVSVSLTHHGHYGAYSVQMEQ